jgi:transcriptional regulator with XRE-family HTH domain
MDIEIGKKVQLARKESGLTQEQAAEKLSVSRQTISNWENEKSYPDIISVIKMSDLYGISLDILLKGEEKMSNNYLQYLEDSTNVVKSNQKKGKTILISVYLLIWSFAMIVFWWLILGHSSINTTRIYIISTGDEHRRRLENMKLVI